jgi:hypothetical protein
MENVQEMRIESLKQDKLLKLEVFLWYTLVDDIRTSGEKLSELKSLLDGGVK